MDRRSQIEQAIPSSFRRPLTKYTTYDYRKELQSFSTNQVPELAGDDQLDIALLLPSGATILLNKV